MIKCLTIIRSNWNLEMLVFEEKGKPEYPEKNLSEQSRQAKLRVNLIRAKSNLQNERF